MDPIAAGCKATRDMAGPQHRYMYPSKNNKIIVRVNGHYLGHFSDMGDAKRVLAKHLKVRPGDLPRRDTSKRKKEPQAKSSSSKNAKKRSKYVHVYRSKDAKWEVIIPSSGSKTKKAMGKKSYHYVGRFDSENDAKVAVRKHSGLVARVRKKSAGEMKSFGRDRFAFFKNCFKDRNPNFGSSRV